jgi:hypothetical protein
MSFDIQTECACCARGMKFRMNDDSSYELSDPTASPLFFVPIVDFTKLKAPSIVDDF